MSPFCIPTLNCSAKVCSFCSANSFEEPLLLPGYFGGFHQLNFVCSQNSVNKLQIAPPRFCVSFFRKSLLSVLLPQLYWNRFDITIAHLQWPQHFESGRAAGHQFDIPTPHNLTSFSTHKTTVAIVAKRAIHQSQWPTTDPALHPVTQPPPKSS